MFSHSHSGLLQNRPFLFNTRNLVVQLSQPPRSPFLSFQPSPALFLSHFSTKSLLSSVLSPFVPSLTSFSNHPLPIIQGRNSTTSRSSSHSLYKLFPTLQPVYTHTCMYAGQCVAAKNIRTASNVSGPRRTDRRHMTMHFMFFVLTCSEKHLLV